MDYYTLAKIKTHCRKKTTGAWISKYLLWWPVSPYLTWAFANLRLTSVFTVVLSIFFISTAALLLFSNAPILLVVSALCIEI
ncbi:MAG TPA: hypothetical protein EYQ81_12570 [Sneathiellales bacterium]|nr:hypothetical protein [Sneathiellales bacterium]